MMGCDPPPPVLLAIVTLIPVVALPVAAIPGPLKSGETPVPPCEAVVAIECVWPGSMIDAVCVWAGIWDALNV
jgi:hypothetical protein